MLNEVFEFGVKLALRQSDPDWLPGKFRQKEKSIKAIDPQLSDDVWVMQPKIDGVGTAILLQKGQRPVVFTAEPKKTGPREHTGKVTAFEKVKTPKVLDGTVVRAELFARNRQTGRVLSGAKIVGMVNAGIEESLKTQQKLNAEFVPALLSVVRYQGKNVKDRPYREQLKIMREIRKQMPQFIIPDTATDLSDKLKMLNAIKAKTHPLTEEGVVFHHLEKGKSRPTVSTVKAKLRPDFDVYVREIFPGKGGREGKAAGGFGYSWTPRGKVVGRVGTGFSHTLVRDMYRNPTKYIGRVAKVQSTGPFPAERGLGALRTPSFKEWHLEKGK